MIRRDAVKILSALTALIPGYTAKTVSAESRKRPLCFEYISQVTALIEKIRANESDNMLEASYNIARTYKNGGNCFSQWETGHSFDGDMFPNRHGGTGIFKMGYTMGKPGAEPKEGDLLLVNVIRKPLDDPRGKGIFVIGGETPWCGDTPQTEILIQRNRDLRIKQFSDIWIDFHITTYGALLWLPGETAPLGPTSGALGMITYWAMVADAVRMLARDGIAVTVKGDAPAVGDNEPRVSLTKPLAEDYFAECIKQIGQIKAEYGTIKAIASSAVDCILSGGKLYVYSRYREALSSEANAKRGGLALINTTHAEDKNFTGTEKDFMIMGIYQPDDEIDIRMLKKFRKTVMKIASIGPATRGGTVPDSETVPGSTDFHLGLMCDTYGLFAVPGVDKKVCPTSGLLANQLLWATMIQIAEDIMTRTGDTPGVLSTGAIIGGGDQRRRRNEMVKVRGY
jgi:uncharacterized phosphosugar-binding protein